MLSWLLGRLLMIKQPKQRSIQVNVPGSLSRGRESKPCLPKVLTQELSCDTFYLMV